jgi:hypothetical protein
MRNTLLIFVVSVWCAGTTNAAQDSVKLAALDVTVWSQRAVHCWLVTMNHYVKGEPAKPSLTKKIPGVALRRYASEFGKN